MMIVGMINISSIVVHVFGTTDCPFIILKHIYVIAILKKCILSTIIKDTNLKSAFMVHFNAKVKPLCATLSIGVARE